MRRIPLVIVLVAASIVVAQDLSDLRRMLRSADFGVRRRAVEALAWRNDRDSVRMLCRGFRDAVGELDDLGDSLDDLDDKYEDALDKMYWFEDRDIDAYNRWVGIHDAIVRRYNAMLPELEQAFRLVLDCDRALPKFSSSGAAEALCDGARHEPNVLARLSYIRSLARPELPEGRDTLLGLLEDRDARLRAQAVRALFPFAKDAAVRKRVAALVEDDHWAVRLGAYGFIARGPFREAVPFLVKAATTETGEMAQAADSYLETLTGQTHAEQPRAWATWWERHREAVENGTFRPAPKERGHRRDASRATFFSLPIDSERIVFALDLSGSMLTDDLKARDQVTRRILEEYSLPECRMGVAMAELIRAIRGLPDGAYFNVVLYADYAKRMSNRLRRVTTGSRRSAIRWILRQRTGTQTNIYDALFRSFNDHLARSGGTVRFEDLPDTIVFLTDGVATRGRVADNALLLELVRLWNQASDVVIHCVGVGKTHDRRLLMDLAGANCGYYVDPSKGRLVPEHRRRPLPRDQLAPLPEPRAEEKEPEPEAAMPGTVAECVAALSGQGERRLRALDTLRAMGPDAAPAAGAIVSLLGSGDFDVLMGAEAALEAIGAGAVEALAEAVAGAKPEVAVGAADVLRNLGEAARPAVGRLLQAARSGVVGVQIAAVAALARTAAKGDAKVLEVLRDLAGRAENARLRRAASRALLALAP